MIKQYLLCLIFEIIFSLTHASLECLNGGKFINSSIDYPEKCECKSGYDGYRCQLILAQISKNTSLVIENRDLISSFPYISFIYFDHTDNGNFTFITISDGIEIVFKIVSVSGTIKLMGKNLHPFNVHLKALNDKRWHKLEVFYHDKKIYGVIDHDVINFSQFDDRIRWSNVNFLLGESTTEGPCLRNVQINKKILNLQTNGTPGCKKQEKNCKSNGTNHSGVCENGICYGIDVSTTAAQECDCHMGFIKTTSDGSCSNETQSLVIMPNDTNRQLRWPFPTDRVKYVDFLANGIKLSLKFRTYQDNCTLLFLSNQNVLHSNLTMELRLNNKIPTLIWETNQLELSGVDASDGRWHVLEGSLHKGLVQIVMDYEEDIMINYTFNSLNIGELPSLRSVDIGNNFKDDAFILKHAAISDVEINNRKIKLSPWNSEGRVFNGCDSLHCPQLKVCELKPGFRACVYPCGEQCMNNGTCINKICVCPDGYSGTYCQYGLPTTTVLPIAMGGFIWWPILLVCLLLLLLFFIICLLFLCCGRKSATDDHICVANEIKQIPENIKEYNFHGGGEEDYLGPIDFSKLMPPFVNKPGPHMNASHKIPVPHMNYPILDSTLEYAFEGCSERVSQADSISILPDLQSVNDDPINFNQLNTWGPKFRGLSSLYNARHTDI